VRWLFTISVYPVPKQEEELHLKNKLPIFPSPAGMPLTKLSLAGNNLFLPAMESLVGDIPDGDGKNYSVGLQDHMGLVENWTRKKEVYPLSVV
jgi:hypothetical protein